MKALMQTNFNPELLTSRSEDTNDQRRRNCILRNQLVINVVKHYTVFGNSQLSQLATAQRW